MRETASARYRHDVLIIGAGLIGLATARELLHRRPGLKVVVLEKETTVAAHQSGHNSGVIHAGMYYPTGSLKAKLCVAGAAALKQYCAEHEIPVDVCGKLIVATSKAEVDRLGAIYERGVANGIARLELVGPERIQEIEPSCRGLAAVWSPSTAIVDFGAVARAYATDVEARGGEVRIGEEVRSVDQEPHGVVVRTARGEVTGSWLIACAGAWSDRVARLDGASKSPVIVPFRGSYWRLRPERTSLVRGLIYPVPDPRFPFLGVHFTRRIDGEVWIGPNALLALARDGYRRRDVRVGDVASIFGNAGFWRFGLRHWRTGLDELVQEMSSRRLLATLRRFIPELNGEDVLPGPSGVRAQAMAPDGRFVDDFAIDDTTRAIHVRNAPSPAATSSLELGRLIAERAIQRFALAR